MKSTLCAVIGLIALTPLAANASRGTCKAVSVKAAIAIEEISAQNTGCEEDCDVSVLLKSVKFVKETTGQDHIDRLGTWEVELATSSGRVRAAYLVDYRSYDLGNCTIKKVELIRGRYAD